MAQAYFLCLFIILAYLTQAYLLANRLEESISIAIHINLYWYSMDLFSVKSNMRSQCKLSM